jgi:predicted permease
VRRRLRGALVVGEIALALVLLTGTGLLLRSLERLQRVPTGFDEEHLLVVPIQPPSSRYESPERALRLYRNVAAAVATVPGVRAVALTNHVPLSGASINTPLEVEGFPTRETDEAMFRVVDTAYFRTVGVPIIRGRDFTADDLRHPGDAALVNQALADRYWSGGDALGKRITIRKSSQGRPEFGEPVHATIVGVVGNVRHFSLDTDFFPEVYLPYTVTVWGWMSLVVRTAGDPAALVSAVGQAARTVEPDLPLDGVSFQNRVYDLPFALRQSLAYRRFVTGLLGAFSLPALLLAALGIYGVVAYLVAQRDREIGIRMALGARRVDVLALVLREGLRLAAVGVLLGTVGAIVTTRWLSAELYETSPTDPLTLAVAALVLAVISLGATLLPARRATAIDPARTLQAE